MEYKEYIKQIGAKNVKPFLILSGSEEYVKKTVIERLKKTFVDESMLEFDMNVFDNQTVDFDALYSAVSSPAMFSERRLVAVSVKPENQIFKDERMEGLAKGLADDVLLVLNVEGKTDKRLALTKKLEALADCVCIDELEHNDVIKWIIQHVKAAGKEISPADAEYLFTFVGNDLFQLRSEIGKLVDCTDENKVTRKNIEDMIAHTPEHGVFTLVDAVAARKTPEAIKQTKLLLDDGSEAFQLLALLERQYQLLFRYLSMVKNGEQQKAIMETLAIKPFLYDKLKKQSAGYTVESCKQALQMCLELDFNVKSGKADAEKGFELLIVKLCSKK